MSWLSSIGDGWIFLLILVAVIIGVVSLVQKKQAIATKIATVLAILFVVTVGYVYIANDLELTSVTGFAEGVRIYFNWMLSLGGNLVDLTSYAIKLNWTTPDNSSLTDKSFIE